METTNFFSQIALLELSGDLNITIKKGSENNWITSVLLQNEKCTDDAKTLIPPLNLRGTAEELDNGFFENITIPLQSASGLLLNMESFKKQLDEAKKQSAMEKEKTEKDKKEKDIKIKRYNDALEKAIELEKEGKFREAWMKVPDAGEFPEKADEIRKRKTELSNKFETNSLFGLLEEPKAEQPIEEEEEEEVSAHFENINDEKEELNF